MQRERPFAFAAVNPAKLPASFPARVNLEQPLERRQRPRRRDIQANFLAHFAHGARVIILAAVQMAGRRRVPLAGRDVLFQRTLLEKDFAARIEDQHMHRTMPQPARVNLAPRAPADYFVALIDNIKYFLGHKSNRVTAVCPVNGKSKWAVVWRNRGFCRTKFHPGGLKISLALRAAPR